MKTLLLLLVLLSTVGSNAFDHSKSFKSVKGLHNGQVVTAEELGAHFEIVSEGNGLKIYVLNFDLKPQSSNSFVVTAKIQMNPKEQAIELPLKAFENHFEARVEGKIAANGAKKYDLYLAVKSLKNSKEDLLKYSVKSTRH